MRQSTRLILIFLLSFPLIFHSQSTYDWYPLKPNTEYNYRFDTALTLSNVLKFDSSKVVSGQTVYYLNKIVTNCDTCKNQTLMNDPIDSTYVLNHQPQFLLHEFRFIAPNIFHFKGKGASLTLKFHTAVGSTWLYDSISSISATTISKTQQMIFGIMDSVATIALTSSDTLALSKKFGLLRFSSYAVSKYKYRLEGIKGSPNYGTQQKFFHDFFSFSAGNIFQYEFMDYDYNIFPGLFKRGHEKWEMLSVNNYQDSIVCMVKKNHYDSTWLGANPPTITSYTQTVKEVFTDSSKHFTNCYPSQEIWVNPYSPYQGSINYIHKVETNKNSNGKIIKSFGENCPNVNLSFGKNGAAEETAFANVYLNRNNGNTQKIIGREATEGLGVTSELYNDYDRIIQSCLIGYIKGNDTSGIIYSSPVGIKEIEKENRYSIFPNPAMDQFFIQARGNASAIVKIYSIDGKLLKEEKLEEGAKLHPINCSDFLNGIYFVSVESGENHFKHKLIISR